MTLSILQGYPENVLEYPIAFAQVREDPWEEKEIIETYFPDRENLSVLMVASGGDTAAYLAGSDFPISEISIVDPNPSQLYLTQLKLHLLQYEPEERLKLLGHREMLDRKEKIVSLMKELDIPKDGWGRAERLDHEGRYEKVFEALREYLAPFKKEIEELFSSENIREQSSKIAPDTSLGKALDEAFQVVMSQENLVKIFGEKATANRLQEFSSHFIERMRHYLSTHLASESPYMAQLLLGQFHQEKRYPWLDLDPKQVEKEISFHPIFMESYLEKMAPETFDLIHLSNITDWLSQDEARKTLFLSYRALKPGGVVVIRQLNSDLDLCSLGEEYTWDLQKGEELNEKDRSFFYRKLLIGVKKPPLQATQMAIEVLKKLPILDGKFFKDLDQMSLEEFQKAQQQFFFAVNYFSRPMAALVARLPSHEKRVSILENILEEHGNFNPDQYHSNTFKQFLKSIGCNMDGVKELPAVLAFNLDLMGISLTEDPYTAIGCFGIIEYAFSDISACIGKKAVERGWVEKERLVHYSLHAELDKKHAEEFFILVDADLQDPSQKAKFQKGLELGAYIFNRLYEDLSSQWTF